LGTFVRYHKLTTTALTMAQQILQLEEIKWEFLGNNGPEENSCNSRFWFTVHGENSDAPPKCRVMCELLVFRPDEVTACFPGHAELAIEGEPTRHYTFHRTKAKKRGYYVYRLPDEVITAEKSHTLSLAPEQTSNVVSFPKKK
jgi:hypothetical protein